MHINLYSFIFKFDFFYDEIYFRLKELIFYFYYYIHEKILFVLIILYNYLV